MLEQATGEPVGHRQQANNYDCISNAGYAGEANMTEGESSKRIDSVLDMLQKRSRSRSIVTQAAPVGVI